MVYLSNNIAYFNISFADNHNIYETLEIIKNDIKTLERAVYSGSIKVKAENNEISTTELDSNSEDVLTRHLLKLSEIVYQSLFAFSISEPEKEGIYACLAYKLEFKLNNNKIKINLYILFIRNNKKII